MIGPAGADGIGGRFFFCPDDAGSLFTTEPPLAVAMAKESEVSIKTTAAIVVSLLKKVAAPRAPKSVWLDPPKAAPSSAPFPLCTRTMKIRKKQTITWTIKINVYISSPS